MVTTNEYFITQMKLRELREQRSRLLQTYNDLRQRVALEGTEVGRLRVLYDGLRQVTFANQQLHPDVANLEPLLGRSDSELEHLEEWCYPEDGFPPRALWTLNKWRLGGGCVHTEREANLKLPVCVPSIPTTRFSMVRWDICCRRRCKDFVDEWFHLAKAGGDYGRIYGQFMK